MRIRTGFDAVDLMAMEYEQLKEEQRLRIGTRDNLLYATLGSQAVIAAGAVQTGSGLLLLLVPPVCLVLGWTYLVNDNRITAIGRYIESTTIPALASRTDAGFPLLAWELAHRTGSGRRSRKVWQVSVDLLTFVVSMMAAVAVVATSIPLSRGTTTVALVELVVGGLLGYQFLAQAVRSARRAVPRPT